MPCLLWPLNCGAVNKNWKGIGGGTQEARGVSGNRDCESSSAWVTLSQLCKSQLEKSQRDPSRSGRLRPTYCIMESSPAFIDLFRKKNWALWFEAEKLSQNTSGEVSFDHFRINITIKTRLLEFHLSLSWKGLLETSLQTEIIHHRAITAPFKILQFESPYSETDEFRFWG